MQESSTKQLLVGLVAVAVVGLGGLWLLQSSSSKSEIMKDNGVVGSSVMEDTNDSMMNDQGMDGMDTEESSMESDEMMAKSGRYVEYSDAEYQQAEGRQRILFFHAKWCPTCKIANEDIEKNLSEVPADVVILKVDYDTETELKEKYGITYQHTFVLVDDDGNQITKWNGGDLSTILEKVQ
ncbi:thioredoxin family protein [Candidatus Woesebacteria bacterium]|nr:thioredoxin family protein [Candidatus Woesebacteria bacterium]